MRGEDLATVADFTVAPGERRALVATWFPSHEPVPAAIDPEWSLRDTESWWCEWSGRCTYEGPWREAVLTSLMVLKALTYGPTGGIVAAPTTSLPEWPGGVRNWDYRYCWLRDATMTLYALMLTGYTEEAAAWREWLLRAVAGDPARLQIMYGVSGERRLTEYEADWLPGYEGSSPVRIGNQAHEQLQLDVYGELIDSLYQAQRFGIGADPWAWSLERALLDSLESRWAAARRGDLGGARPAPALHPLEGDGVGRVRSRHPISRVLSAGGADRALARDARPDPPRGLRARLRSRAQRLHAVVRLVAASTRVCC